MEFVIIPTMKTIRLSTILLWTLVLTMHMGSSFAQEADAKSEIVKAIRQYYRALAHRDIDALRQVLDENFIVVEAKHAAAKVHVVNVKNGSTLLPPEGNDDWNQVEVSSINVEISSSHASVAIASLTLKHPLSEERITGMQDVLKTRPEVFGEAERKTVEKRIADRAIHNSEFAMLALKGGKWKIVSMSVPD